LDDKIKKDVMNAYQTGSSSIQDIARVFRVDVDDVLNLTGNGHLATVHTSGDLVDRQEVGPNVPLSQGQEYQTPITLN
jgi:hypothetical protein